jgi:hypothetical protein
MAPDGSAERLSKVGAAESITSEVMDFDLRELPAAAPD